MTPESVLTGKVVLASTGEPVAGVEVSAAGSGGLTSTLSDAEGRFTLDRLAPGSYKPWAEGDELYGQAANQTHLGLGQTSEEVIVRVYPAAHVEGRVRIAGADQPCTHGMLRLHGPGSQDEYGELDDEGHVELRAVLPGHYEVSVTCLGYLADEHYPALVVADHDLDGLEWEVHDALTIAGLVVDEAGDPIAGARVQARPVVEPDAARSRTTRSGADATGGDGGFELAGLLPGRYELSAAIWNGPSGPSEPLTVALEPGSNIDDVRLVMPAVGSIRGRVVDPSGQPVLGAMVAASLVSQAGGGSAFCDDVGGFVIDGLPAGQARVVAHTTNAGSVVLHKPGTHDDDVQGELVEVVAHEVAELTLTVEPLDGRIRGVVVDESGAPIADAFIDVERMSDSAGASRAVARHSVRWSWTRKPVLTDADGRFALDGLPDGRFILRGNRKGGGEGLLEDVALGSQVELVITTTGELAGTVQLADASAPERMRVTLRDEAQAIELSDEFFRTDGAWRFTEVPPGDYEISASASAGKVTLAQTTALDGGEVHEGIALVLLGRVTLRGRVVDLETHAPIAGITLDLPSRDRLEFGKRDPAHRNVTGADGRFEIEDAATGNIMLRATSRTGGSEAEYDWLVMPLTLDAEPAVHDIGDLELVAKRLGPDQRAGDLGFTLVARDPDPATADWTPTIASVRPDGPAASSGLAVGDVIAKVDGHAVGGIHESRYRTLTHVREGTTLTLTLDAGTTVAFVVGPPVR
jgi:protocatechuate 3,4-dioxygenase beta subunit